MENVSVDLTEEEQAAELLEESLVAPELPLTLDEVLLFPGDFAGRRIALQGVQILEIRRGASSYELRLLDVATRTASREIKDAGALHDDAAVVFSVHRVWAQEFLRSKLQGHTGSYRLTFVVKGPFGARRVDWVAVLVAADAIIDPGEQGITG